MAISSLLRQERLLILGLGFTTCAVLGLMRRMLIHYRDIAIIPPLENKPHHISQESEDSLRLSTLDKLLNNPNYGIQETAAIIVLERAISDAATVDALLWCITRPDHDTRERGIRALAMVLNNSTAGFLHKPKTYRALVKSLEYSMKDYEHHTYDPEWDNWHLRDVTELGCLIVIGQLIHKFDIDELLDAGFVERWLAKEPWGGKNDDERQCNFMDSLAKETRLAHILLPLFRHEKGRQRLADVKLIPPKTIESLEETIASVAIEDILRPRDQNTAEGLLRRRNREAMVLNDGTRPFGRDDIIQREPSGA